MDFLERPEIKKTYDKCKYIVKLWEHDFKKTNGRLPSKLDIREADRRVRDAYRKYYQLKTKALEQSFKDIEGFYSDEETTTENEFNNSIQHETCDKTPSQAPETVDLPPDETWGSHLNKETKKKESGDGLNTSITKKLFCGSKLSKRYSRKSLSFSQKKSETNIATTLSQPTQSFTESTDCDNSQNENDQSVFEQIFNTTNVKVASASQNVCSQSTNIIQSVLDNKYKTLKKVDVGWLERVGTSSGVSIEKPDNIEDETNMSLDYDSDDIIDNSDDEPSIDLGHKSKKFKMDSLDENGKNEIAGNNYTSEENQSEIDNITCNEEAANDQMIQNDQNSENVEPVNKLKSQKTPISDPFGFKDDIFEPIKRNQLATPEAKSKQNLESQKTATADPFEFKDDIFEPIKTNLLATPKPKTKRRTSKTKKTQIINKEIKTQSIRQSARANKTQVNMTESHSEDEDPFHSDNNSDDPEFTLDENTNKLKNILAEQQEDIDILKTPTIKKNKKSTEKGEEKNKNKTRPKRTPNKQETENKEEDDNTTYELEYSIKPRVSTPRFKNIKKLIKIETSSTKSEAKEHEPQIKDKRHQELEKLEKKIESGSLNDNFVRINLKKKVYCRGKKNMNFSKYKKQQWKTKKKALAGPDMDMGGCDGGMFTCFNCGQIGHFARHCQKTKGDALLPLEADEEVCPFPTLEEASQMAKESHLTIRKPNLDTKESHDDGKEEEENNKSEGESDNELFDDAETEILLAETLKLEEHAAKLDLQFYLDHVKVVDPYYKLNEDGSIIDTPEEVFAVLNKFGHSSFRAGQELAVMRILSGKSTLVTLSTGSGKSLCYQLPAYLYSQREPCISLIVSPLVSLMEDQVTGIPSFLKAACLHTNQTKGQREKIMEAISSGNLNVLLVSPEAVVAGERSTGFGSLLRKLPPIAFACIDEAHCVSQWSHNFRPSYLMICRVLRERMGVKIILGLTATATRATSDSIIEHLQIPDGRAGIISDVPLPDNLSLTVSKDHQRDQALLALLCSERFQNCKSIIIYCTRREECNRITKFLRTSLQYEASAESKKRKRISVQAEPYHAGLSASRRRTIQKSFMSGELRIVVATVAFGMGINKSDIRAVIHYNMPKNFESYVQEIGRAGRDGLPAHCHLFLDAKGNDENELRRHIYANSIDRHIIRKLLQKIFLPCSCKDMCPKHEVAFSIEETVRALDIPEENISTLLCYLELHEKRYIEILSPAYTVCKVISYGGPLQIRKAAKECPPLAMALALQKNKAENDLNVLEFAVIDIAAAIGWDSGICKHKLKNLEWITVNGQPKRSTLNVSFSNLGFRVLAPGNLNDDQLDEALDSLHQHVVNQEKTALLQLRAVHQTLVDVAAPSYKLCLSPEIVEGNAKLKAQIRQYFDSPNPLESISLEENKLVDEELIVNNIRGLISIYRDNNFTGKAIARIFHGIMSPNYPAVIWGRCKYWRCHINISDVHFKEFYDLKVDYTSR